MTIGLNWKDAAAIAGTSRQAVQDLVKRGVITESVLRDQSGKPTGIKSREEFLNEYAAKVRARAGRRVSSGAGVVRELRPATERMKSVVDQAPESVRGRNDEIIPEYNESRAKTEYEKSLLLELERRQKEGLLVERKAVETTWAKLITDSKTRILGVPSRAKARIPHLSLEEVEILSVLIREALEELSEEGDGEER